MNIGILLALMAFLAFRGNGNGSSAKVADPKNGLSGYTGFAYFPLFYRALPMEDDTPFVRTDRYSYDQWENFVASVMPNTYALYTDPQSHKGRIMVYERTDFNKVIQRGWYNPDLRMKVVDGVPETAEASE